MGQPELSVVIPIYDEASVLEGTLAGLFPYLESLGRPFEVIGVDDGSRDGSGEILARTAASEPRLVVESLDRNRGKGAAVRAGMLRVRGSRALFMDADLSTPFEAIPTFLAQLDAGHAVVIGTRRAPGARITRHQPWLRETLGRGFTALTRLMFGIGASDFTCGFKAFRGEAAREIFRRSTLDGWAFDVELLVIARELGLELVQLPVEWHDEEGTKVRMGSAIRRSFGELLTIRRNRRRGLYR